MNLMILSLGTRNNYGGLLQNFALQKVLQKEKIHVKTINCLVVPPLWRIFLSWIKTFFLLLRGKRRSFVHGNHRRKRADFAEQFMQQFVVMTESYSKLTLKLLKKNPCDCIIVGSDQVWRPKYNYRIEDMYLKFAGNFPIKRIAYAASFGVDEWEYTPKQTYECSKLAKKFDAISVREESGIKLCDDNLGVCATWVLDPTLLLKKEDYLEVCKDVPFSTEKILVAYVLDMSESVSELCKSVAKERGLVIKMLRADFGSVLSVPEWLAMFRDASYVVTDSFHGTIFSIIFGKDFKSIYNKKRGAARFESLLNLYNSGRLEEMRNFSINWLKKALEK